LDLHKKNVVAVIRFRHCELRVCNLAEGGFIFTSGSLGRAEIAIKKEYIMEKELEAKPPVISLRLSPRSSESVFT
jgi:hypothetical protein